jgi:hypothetical protein
MIGRTNWLPLHYADKWAPQPPTSGDQNENEDASSQPHVNALPCPSCEGSSSLDFDHTKDPTIQAEYYRALAWRVLLDYLLGYLLGYLPIHTELWTETLSTRRTWYRKAAMPWPDWSTTRPTCTSECRNCSCHRHCSTSQTTKLSIAFSQSDHAATLSSACSLVVYQEPPLPCRPFLLHCARIGSSKDSMASFWNACAARDLNALQDSGPGNAQFISNIAKRDIHESVNAVPPVETI